MSKRRNILFNEDSTDAPSDNSKNGVRSKKNCLEYKWPETSDQSSDESSDESSKKSSDKSSDESSKKSSDKSSDELSKTSRDESSYECSNNLTDQNVYFDPGELSSGEEYADQSGNQKPVLLSDNFHTNHSKQEFNSGSETNSSAYVESTENDSGKY